MAIKTKGISVYYWCICCLLGSIALISATHADEDAIAIVVNDSVVLKSEVIYRGKEIKATHKGLSDSVAIKKAAESLALEYLQAEKAQEQGVNISDAAVDAVITKIARKNNKSLNELKAIIEKRKGTNYSRYYATIRRQMLVTKLREKYMAEKTNISEYEINNLIRAESRNLLQGARFEINHFLLPIPKGATLTQFKQLRQSAEQKRLAILKGQSFSQASNNSASKQWVEASEAPPSMLRELSVLTVGEISPVYQDSTGFHIVGLLSRLDQKNGMTKDALQNQAKTIIGKSKSHESYKLWLEDQMNSAHIEYRLDN